MSTMKLKVEFPQNFKGKRVSVERTQEDERTADPGEPAAGIAAVKIALDDVLDDRTEIAMIGVYSSRKRQHLPLSRPISKTTFA
jgi:hypothetical protein